MTRCQRAVRQSWAFVFLTIVVHTVQAQQAAPSASTARKLTIVGTSLFQPLVTDIARRFESLHPGVSIELQAGGSGKGLADVRSGAADITMMPRALKSDERDVFAYPIARGGVAVIVNQSNPVKDMTSGELTGVLTGRITNWKSLGGRDAPINLAWRNGQGSTVSVLEHLKLKRDVITRNVAIATNDDAIKFVVSDSNGVALASVAISTRSMQAGAPIKLLSFNGFPAASRTIQNHTYELSRPLLLVTRQPAAGIQKEFVDYAGSARVIDLQLKYGFVPYQE